MPRNNKNFVNEPRGAAEVKHITKSGIEDKTTSHASAKPNIAEKNAQFATSLPASLGGAHAAAEKRPAARVGHVTGGGATIGGRATCGREISERAAGGAAQTGCEARPEHTHTHTHHG